jgi:hypothetical protein
MKGKFSLSLVLLSLASLSLCFQAKASDEKLENRTNDGDRISQILQRVEEINALEIKSLSKEERKSLKAELKDYKNEIQMERASSAEASSEWREAERAVNKSRGGIFISTTALVIIIILLIIL